MAMLATLTRTLHAAHHRLQMPDAALRLQAAQRNIFVDPSAKPSISERIKYSGWAAGTFLQAHSGWRKIDNFVASEKLLASDSSWVRLAGGQAVSALFLGVKIGAVACGAACAALAIPLIIVASSIYTHLAHRALFTLEAQLDNLLERNMHAQQALNQKLFEIYREVLFRLDEQGRISPWTLAIFARIEENNIDSEVSTLQNAISTSGFWSYLSREETEAVRARESAAGALVFQWRNEVAQVVLGQAAKHTAPLATAKQATACALVSQFRNRTQASSVSLCSTQQSQRPFLQGAEGSWVHDRLSPSLVSKLFDARFALALDLDTQRILKRGQFELARRLGEDDPRKAPTA